MRRIWAALAQYKSFAGNARSTTGADTPALHAAAQFESDARSPAYKAGFRHGADAGREHGVECSLSAHSAGHALMTLVGIEEMARILGVNNPTENGQFAPAFERACTDYNRGFAAGWDEAETAALEQVGRLTVSAERSLQAAARAHTAVDRILVPSRPAVGVSAFVK